VKVQLKTSRLPVYKDRWGKESGEDRRSGTRWWWWWRDAGKVITVIRVMYGYLDTVFLFCIAPLCLLASSSFSSVYLTLSFITECTSLSLSLSLLLLEALTNARRCLTAWPDRCNPPTPCPHVGNNPYKSQWLQEVWRFLNTHSTYAEVSRCNCTVFSDSGLFLLLLVVGCRDFLLVVWYAHCYWVTE
jgi:hypothetical protein